MIANLAASIHARLLAKAKARGEDFNLVLTRYGLERFLYRLSVSPARDHYLLKGALLFDLWFDVPHRPTRDADFLGFGAADREALARHVRDVCSVVSEDGMTRARGLSHCGSYPGQAHPDSELASRYRPATSAGVRIAFTPGVE